MNLKIHAILCGNDAYLGTATDLQTLRTLIKFAESQIGCLGCCVGGSYGGREYSGEMTFSEIWEHFFNI